MIAFSPVLNQITQLHQTGEFTSADTLESLNLAVDSCTKIRDAVSEYLKKTIKEQ